MKAETVLAPRRFDHFVLDEADARLTRGGQVVPLAPKPFAVLCALARTPDRLLTKNQLLDLVWGHRFVTNASLKSAISELRAALEDDPKQPRYIATVSRRGYRFIAASADSPTQAAAAHEPEETARPCAARTCGAHGSVPRRCRARGHHPEGSCNTRKRAAHRQRILVLRTPHDHDHQRRPARDAKPVHGGNRYPARARTVQAAAQAVRISAGCGSHRGRCVCQHFACLSPHLAVCTTS